MNTWLKTTSVLVCVLILATGCVSKGQNASVITSTYLRNLSVDLRTNKKADLDSYIERLPQWFSSEESIDSFFVGPRNGLPFSTDTAVAIDAFLVHSSIAARDGDELRARKSLKAAVEATGQVLALRPTSKLTYDDGSVPDESYYCVTTCVRAASVIRDVKATLDKFPPLAKSWSWVSQTKTVLARHESKADLAKNALAQSIKVPESDRFRDAGIVKACGQYSSILNSEIKEIEATLSDEK